MDAPGGRDERRTQQERLRREEAYYHFINGLSEEEYRLMRDSDLLGTPGEVTAEELRQRLNGAKERLSAQTHPETRPQNSSSLGEDGTAGGVEAAVEASNGDSLLEWLNTFRRTGNATRSGQSGNQTWRAVSRTNPNSGEFRFSLEININHEQPESGDLSDQPGHADLHSPAQGRRPQTRRTRSGAVPPLTLPLIPPELPAGRVSRALGQLRPPPTPSSQADSHSQRSPSSRTLEPQSHQSSGRLAETQGGGEEQDSARHACPRVPPDAGHQGVLPSSRTRARGRGGCRSGAGRASRRSRSPLHRLPDVPSGTSETGASQPAVQGSPQSTLVAALSSGTSALPHSAPGASQPAVLAAETQEVAMETGDQVTDLAPEPEPLPLAESAPEAGEEEAQAAGGGGGVRRHPTIMLDLQVRRIRPGETRDRDSIASRTRSRVRMAENTVTFESDSGGFRRTISRSERAGVRTYVSTIRIPLRRISETGLGEPSSTALRSILRQIMTGFGELSSLMETEADAEEAGPASQTFRIRGNERSGSQEAPAQERRDVEGEARVGANEEDQGRLGGTPADARPTSRDTNNLVENGTLPILRLAHFFLLNDEEDEEHPRGLTKEQIDNLSTRTYCQASLEGELGRACSICISEYAQGNKLRRLPCAHEFHIHCIDRWLSENNTCPICRQPILPAHPD